MSAITEKFINDEISRGLTRANLAHNNALRAELLKDAELGDGPVAAVRVRGVSIDDRISELKSDPRFAAAFPADSPTLRSTDMAKLKENFDAVASGRIRVE